MKKLSVIIPVYNMENYIHKCLNSVIYPNVEDYEIVIVDDGSTDYSPFICEEFAVHYPNLIKFISTPNGGLGAARNVGVEHAEGEYLFFLDSDDYLDENALNEILEFIKEEADIYIFDFAPVTEEGKSLGITSGCDRIGKFSFEEYPELLFCPPNACNKIWKRSFFTQCSISFPGRVWFEDLHTIPKLYPLAKSICYTNKAWYKYLYRPGSITQTKNPSRCIEIIGAVDSVLEYYKAVDCFDKFHNELEYMALYHQVITSTTRVNLIDRKSDIQQKLYSDYVRKFPDYRKNPYVLSMPKKLKLLLFFIEHKMYFAFNITMRLNDIVKGKK